MGTSVTEIGHAQDLISKEPLSFVAALFALAFVATLWLYVRAVEKHRQEAQRMSDAYAERAIKGEVALVELVSMAADIHELTTDQRRKRERRESQTRIPIVTTAEEP